MELLRICMCVCLSTCYQFYLAYIEEWNCWVPGVSQTVRFENTTTNTELTSDTNYKSQEFSKPLFGTPICWKDWNNSLKTILTDTVYHRKGYRSITQRKRHVGQSLGRVHERSFHLSLGHVTIPIVTCENIHGLLPTREVYISLSVQFLLGFDYICVIDWLVAHMVELSFQVA